MILKLSTFLKLMVCLILVENRRPLGELLHEP